MEIWEKFIKNFFVKKIHVKFLIEIPDFGGNSRRNHPEPEGNFWKFPEGRRPEGNFQKFSEGEG